jgi:flagellin
MAFSIQTNVASMQARRSLAATQSVVDGALARLSSGFRITRASDDAAGLGISTKLEAQLRSHGQAVRNASDGLSVVQSAEAGLGEQASLLTRLRELAIQSASDGIGNVERGYLQREATALVRELQRISQVTEYNGTRLLDGSAATLDFQVGIAATANDLISLSTLDTSTKLPYLAPPAAAAQSAACLAFAASYTTTAPGDLLAARTAAYNASMAALPSASIATQLSQLTADLATLGGAALVTATAGGGAGGHPGLAAAYQAFAGVMASTGNLATANGAANTAANAAAPGSGVAAANAARGVFVINLWAAGGSTGAGVVPPGPALDAAVAALGEPGTSGGLGLVGFSLASKPSARAGLGAVDGALERVSAARATLGATGNRLERAIASIKASSEALAAANGRIKDVDVAEETSRLSRAQILAQAGVSVLAQANLAPQLALKLLG